MTDKHVSFEQLSDLHDDIIATQDEKEAVLEHLESCQQCMAEYEKLKKTVTFLAELQGPRLITKNIPQRVVAAYRIKQKKKNFMKSLPAIAASFIVIIGVALFDSGKVNTDHNKYAIKSANGLSGVEKLNQVLNKNKARILKITDLYTECEIDVDKFRQLRRDLGFRKVTYRVVRSSNYAHAPHNWRNIEEVGAGNIIPGDKLFTDDTSSEPKTTIRFRVYR